VPPTCSHTAKEIRTTCESVYLPAMRTIKPTLLCATLLLVGLLFLTSGCVSSATTQSATGEEPMLRVSSSAPEIFPPSAH